MSMPAFRVHSSEHLPEKRGFPNGDTAPVGTYDTVIFGEPKSKKFASSWVKSDARASILGLGTNTCEETV
jgi:hypothetical protein